MTGKRARTAATSRPGPRPARRASRRADESKGESTRRHILAVALAQFRRHGFEKTTMRDIAAAAGVALGATYYHFPSKDSLLFAFYAQNHADMERSAAAYPPGEPLRQRLGRLLHAKLDDVAANRRLLRALVPRLADPGDAVSAFSAESADIRTRTIALFDRALDGEGLTEATRHLAAQCLWLLHLGLMLYIVNDRSEDAARSHRLTDDLLDIVVPLIALARSPIAAPLIWRFREAIVRAGLALPPSGGKGVE